jgi:hypothetical protein
VRWWLRPSHRDLDQAASVHPKRLTTHPRGHPTIHLSKSTDYRLVITTQTLACSPPQSLFRRTRLIFVSRPKRGRRIISSRLGLSIGCRENSSSPPSGRPAVAGSREVLIGRCRRKLLRRTTRKRRDRLLALGLFSVATATSDLIRQWPRFKHRGRIQPWVGEPTGADYVNPNRRRQALLNAFSLQPELTPALRPRTVTVHSTAGISSISAMSRRRRSERR